MRSEARMMLTILILITVFKSSFTDEGPIIQINNGKIRGTVLETYNGDNFYAFQGIPFAEPPVGHLRFQPPQPPKNWDSILENENANKKCIQISRSFLKDESEDCLYLNVYTPQLPTEDQNVSLPVMVYIHGGGFGSGSDSIIGFRPHKFMDYGIIMVAIQYRLGLLGFLSTGDLECPGNNGFKDQQFALRWIQENIKSFGGDPTRVTVAGESAGGASAGYQMLASNAEGLFQGSIQASGSFLSPVALQRNPRSIAFQVASYIDPAIDENNTTKELMDFFKTVDVSQIKKASCDIFGEDFIGSFFNLLNGFVFSGVIEPEHDGAFLTETGFQKLQTGNFKVIPTLISINSEEAVFLANESIFLQQIKDYDTSPELLVTPSMHIVDQDIKRRVGNDIRRLYVGDASLQDNIGPSLKYLSDGGFGRPAIKQAQLQAKYADVFFYEFAYSGALGRAGRPATYIPGADTVMHGEDLSYIFPKDREQVEKYSEMDILTVDRMVLIWTNFVKYLNPTPESSDVLQNVTWPKLSPTERFSYLLINETIEIQYDLKKPMIDEYQRLFDLYAVPPMDTY